MSLYLRQTYWPQPLKTGILTRVRSMFKHVTNWRKLNGIGGTTQAETS